MGLLHYYRQEFGQSSKTAGANLEIKSHRLLLAAGYIQESTAGRYYLLPLGLRVQQKIIAVIKEEMDASGAQELIAPILHPLSLWEETNRDQTVGFELMQVEDRRGARFALGGTAEEMFVDLVRKQNISYRQLPFNLYQFGWKFRDEFRARGGLLRVREFIMKDAYSFSTKEQFAAIYQKMKEVYSRIFERLGLKTTIVLADNGYIGGDYCHEFVVESEVGESTYFLDQAGQASHEDVAKIDKNVGRHEDSAKELKEVACQRGPTMADSLAAHQPSLIGQHIKNVAYRDQADRLILACLRGDLAVNETKLAKLTSSYHLTALTDQEIRQQLNSEPGFISAVNLKPKTKKLLIVADDSLKEGHNLISGANKPNYDYVGISLGRDFQPDIFGDIVLAQAGQPAPAGGQLVAKKGIEVGNTFQLGYHYSQKMARATYSNQAGQLEPYYMGCYGIGVGRTLAAIAEVTADSAGLVWPAKVSPYDIFLLALSPSQTDRAKELASKLVEANWQVLYDDREQIQPGEKLANAELLGIPLIVAIGQKTASQGQVEVKLRQELKWQIVAQEEITNFLAKVFQDLS